MEAVDLSDLSVKSSDTIYHHGELSLPEVTARSTESSPSGHTETTFGQAQRRSLEDFFATP